MMSPEIKSESRCAPQTKYGACINSTSTRHAPATRFSSSQPVELLEQVLVGDSEQIAFTAGLPACDAPSRDHEDVAARPFKLMVIAGYDPGAALHGIDAVGRRLRFLDHRVRGEVPPFDPQRGEIGRADHDLAQAGARFRLPCRLGAPGREWKAKRRIGSHFGGAFDEFLIVVLKKYRAQQMRQWDIQKVDPIGVLGALIAVAVPTPAGGEQDIARFH